MTDRRHVSEEWRGTLWAEAYSRRGAGGDFNAALVMKLRTGGDTFHNNVPRPDQSDDRVYFIRMKSKL